MNDDILFSEPPTREDTLWIDRLAQLVGSSITAVEEAAKQLIAMITVMQGIYAVVLAFSGIRDIPKENPWALILYATPIVLWLAALYFALAVLRTRRYDFFSNSPDSAKATFHEIADYKQRRLTVAYWLICLSFAVALIGIFYWLLLPAPVEPSLPSIDLKIR